MIRNIYRMIVPFAIRDMISCIRSKDYRLRREKKKHFGNKNPDKTFYVIRSERPNWGLLTTVTNVLEHIWYALDNDYIPVVDFKNYFLDMIQDQKNRGKINAWENYFDPVTPCVELDEVYQSRDVVLSWISWCPPHSHMVDWHKPLSKETIREYYGLVKKYLKVNDELASRINKAKEKLFPVEGKVLGVSVRRGYEFSKHNKHVNVKDHPEQAGLEEYIEDIDVLMKEWNCEYLFVSTDDREASDYFVNRYGTKCVRLQRALRHFFLGGQILDSNVETIKDQFCEYKLDDNNNILNIEETTKEYLTEVYLLAQCDCLLASISSSSQMACIINGNAYEHVKIYDKGLINVKEN